MLDSVSGVIQCEHCGKQIAYRYTGRSYDSINIKAKYGRVVSIKCQYCNAVQIEAIDLEKIDSIEESL